MASPSQTPIRRAEGYLIALVEWGYRTRAKAEVEFEQFLRPSRIKNWELMRFPMNKEYFAGAPELQHASPEVVYQCVYQRLDVGDEFAGFCRGYLYALNEQGLITADVAEGIMNDLAAHTSRGAQWLVSIPEQLHPLKHFSARQEVRQRLLIDDLE